MTASWLYSPPVASAAPTTAANVVDYTQCANGAPPSASSGCPQGWINGILQGSNSHYREDEVTPQRVVVQVPKGSRRTDRTLTFRYQARKGNIHAYDSLATWNYTQTTADPCVGLPVACPGGTPDTHDIPDDPQVVYPAAAGKSAITAEHMIPAGEGREMTMYGGTITAVSVPVHDNPAATGDDYASVTVTYSVPSTTTARNVMLLFGGHLAAPRGARGWGVGLGAASISGGPYHIKFEAADGASVGNRDNQIQGAAILFPELVITKTADRAVVDVGSDVGFTVSVTNSGTGKADNVVVSDPLPAGPGISWSVSPVDAACSISAAPQILTCTYPELASKATVSVHVTSGTTTDSAGTYRNTATVRADHLDPLTATAQVVVAAPRLTVAKDADAPQVSSGEAIGFTVTVRNDGAGTARAVTVSDSLPPGEGISWSISPAYTGPGTCAVNGSVGAQVLACSLGDLAAGAAASVHVGSATTSRTSGTFRNIAVVRAGNHAEVQDDAQTVVNAPGLTVDKSVDDASVSSGDAIGFTVVVSNTGIGTALGATLSDPLPSGTGISWTLSTYASPGSCSITGSVGTQVLGCSFGNLAPNASALVHVSSATTGATAGTFDNTATAAASNAAAVDDTASVTVNQPNLQTSKTADNPVVSSGDAIGFSITVTNAGTGIARSVTLSDPLPATDGVSWSLDVASADADDCSLTGLTLSCSFGDLIPNANRTVRVTATTTSATTGRLTNTATASSTNNPDASSTATVTVQQPRVTVTKTGSAESVSAGTPITFTVGVGNSGPGIARSVNLNDPLPSAPGVQWTISPAYAGPGTCAITGSSPQVLNCQLGDLAAGVSRTVTVASATTTATAGTLTNVATATPTNGAGASATATIVVLQPVLGVDKVAERETVSSGESIAFAITTRNTGRGTATGVSLTDSLPAAAGVSWVMNPVNGACSLAGTAPAAQTLTCNVGSLAPDATFSVRLASATTHETSGDLDNTALVTSTNHRDVEDSARITVRRPVLNVTKSPVLTPVSAGDTIGFTIDVTNDGSGTAFAATLVDALPAANGLVWRISPAYTSPGTCSLDSAEAPQTLRCAFGHLAAAAGASIRLTSATNTETVGEIPNTATVSADNHLPKSDDAVVVVLQPDLTVTKTADLASVSSGTPIGFTITVANAGPGVARGATLTDTLPDALGVDWQLAATGSACQIVGTPPTERLGCSFGDLAAGASVTVRVTSSTTEATTGELRNVAVAAASNHDPVESSAAVITVNQPNLAVRKTAARSVVSSGDAIGFSIAVTVAGPGTATGVTLSDPLPEGPGLHWSFVGTAPTGCAITGSAPQVLACNLGDLAPLATVAVHLTSPTVTATVGPFPNTATADATNSPARTSTDTVTVNQPGLTLSKTADAETVDAGDAIGFTLRVGNTGDGIARQVTITDPLPQGDGLAWTISPAYTGSGTCAISGATLTCVVGDLAKGGSASVHVSSPTSYTTPGTIPNTAVAKAGNHGDVQDSATITVDAPSLSVDKFVDASPVSSGDQVGFTMVVTNGGPGTAAGVRLNDPLPAIPGSDWRMEPAISGCAIDGAAGAQTLTCAFGSLGVGGERSVHIVSTTGSRVSGTFDNTATVSADNHPESSDTDSVTVNPPSLTISKTADDASVDATEPIGFTMTVTNNGSGVSHETLLDDPLPGGAGIDWTLAQGSPDECSISGSVPEQTLLCQIGDLDADATFTVRVTSETTTASSGGLTNTAKTRSANNPEIPASATVTVLQPRLTVVKTADQSSVSATQDIGFNITVTNEGAGNALDTTLDDPLPMGTGLAWSISPGYDGTCTISGTSSQRLTCSFGDLAPGDTVAVHVSSGTTLDTSGSFTNTAEAAAANYEPVFSTAAVVTVNRPSLSLTKVADASDVNAGQPIGFTMTLGNTGPGTAFNVTLNDPLPGGTGIAWSQVVTVTGGGACLVSGQAPAQTLSCSFGTLAPGQTRSAHVTATTTVASKGVLRNVATLSASNHLNVVDDATVTIHRPDLQVSKTTCTETAVPGGRLGYTITFGNSGDAPAVDAVLTDTLPPGTTVRDSGGGTVSGNTISWQVGTLAPGTAGLTRSVIVDVAVDRNGLDLVNRVALTSPTATPATDSTTTEVTNTGADGDARAYGLQASLLGGTIPLPATPDTDTDGDSTLVEPVQVPGVTASVLAVAESGGVTDGNTTETAISTVKDVAITVAGTAIRAKGVVAMSRSSASALTASSSTSGSLIQELVIGNERYTDLREPTTIAVKSPTGALVARVHVLPRATSGAAAGVRQPVGGTMSSGLAVTALRVEVLDLPTPLVDETGEVVVAHAETAASFPSGLGCGGTLAGVLGDAYVADVTGVTPSLAAAKLGLVTLGSTGGQESATIATFAPLGAGTGSTSTAGALDPLAAQSFAQAAGLNLLGGALTARAVEAVSRTNGAEEATLTDVNLGGTDLCEALGLSDICRPAPNTVLLLEGATTLVLLNEQVTEAGGVRVNAVHIYVLGADNPLGLPVGAELVLSSAYAGAVTGP